ncbi:MAG: elongation factor P [Phycisphaeraceae bacterium]|nr:elongation factor P [Phycisphaeraceae bacterium]
MKSQELRNGMAIDVNGAAWMVVTYDHVKPGKGPAYTQVKLKNLITGSHMEKRFRSGETVEQLSLDRREMEYLYSESAGGVFMDLETYDQITVPKDMLGNTLNYIKANGQVTAHVLKGQVINIDMPVVVDLEVTDTTPGIKDATKTNQLKEATLETGVKTRVPPFIKIGELVRVNTETGEYQCRATE